MGDIAGCSPLRPIRGASGTTVIYSVQADRFIWAQRPSGHRAACDMTVWGPFRRIVLVYLYHTSLYHMFMAAMLLVDIVI